MHTNKKIKLKLARSSAQIDKMEDSRLSLSNENGDRHQLLTYNEINTHETEKVIPKLFTLNLFFEKQAAVDY